MTLQEKVAMTIYSWTIIYSSAPVDLTWRHLGAADKKLYRKRSEQIIQIIAAAERKEEV